MVGSAFPAGVRQGMPGGSCPALLPQADLASLGCEDLQAADLARAFAEVLAG